MENQRRTPSRNTDRGKGFRKGGERTYGYPRQQNRDTGFQPRGDRFPPREGSGPRDNRFGKRPDGRFAPRGDRPPGRDKFAPKGKPGPAWKDAPKVKIVSDLQITDGRLRGKYFANSLSPRMAVSSRRIRDTLFKILFRRIRARRFLDLYAGAGTMGLEAISRGAIISTFVERSSKMCSFIRKNMETLEIKTGHGEVVEMEVIPFLMKMSKRRRFWDVVCFHPPRGTNFDAELNYLSRGASLTKGGTLVVEHASEVFLPERLGVLRRWRVVVQGENAVSFFERV